MLDAWPQVSLCVRAERRFGVLVLGAAEPRWAMRCPAMSCWLLQGPALRLAVSWYALLALPVNTAGGGVGLVIGNRIAYMGSANTTLSSQSNLELMTRLVGAPVRDVEAFFLACRARPSSRLLTQV